MTATDQMLANLDSATAALRATVADVRREQMTAKLADVTERLADHRAGKTILCATTQKALRARRRLYLARLA